MIIIKRIIKNYGNIGKISLQYLEFKRRKKRIIENIIREISSLNLSRGNTFISKRKNWVIWRRMRLSSGINRKSSTSKRKLSIKNKTIKINDIIKTKRNWTINKWG